MPSIPSRFLADIPQDLIVAPPRPASRAGASAGWTRAASGRRRLAEGEAVAGNGASPAPGIATGDKVRHAKFGDGMVMACDPSGDDYRVTVIFGEEHGIKRLLLGFANLEKV